MYEVIVLNNDKERIALDVNQEALLRCLESIESGKTFHVPEEKTGFFFPKENIKCVSYHEKLVQPIEEVTNG
jgi:hypothetical protein